MVYFGLDTTNKVIQYPAGWSARPVYPHQAGAEFHIAGSFVALPATRECRDHERRNPLACARSRTNRSPRRGPRPVPDLGYFCEPESSDFAGYSPLGLILRGQETPSDRAEVRCDWTEEPKYPELRDRLLAAYHLGTLPALRADIEELLGLPAPRTDQERLDWIMSFLNADLELDRPTIDRLMAESELQAKEVTRAGRRNTLPT